VTEHDAPERPNVLWLCSDQQRFDTLGCYGNAFVETPNLDALADGGTLFESAFSQSPICTPSRASFLTGRYPRTTRCRQNGQSIPDDEVLVTQLLQQAGYPLDGPAPIITLKTRGPRDPLAGIDHRPGEIGRVAVDFVNQDLQLNRTGLPASPLTIMIDCTWVETPQFRAARGLNPRAGTRGG